MNHEITVPVNDDLGEMLNWAVRYSLGRRTYAPHDTCRYITPLVPHLNNRTLWCMARDIRRQEPFGLGDECDEVVWEQLLSAINNELSRRPDTDLLDAIG